MADNIPNKCNLIVNYLPQTLTDLQFHELFESVGKTTYTRIIRDKMSSYSFGYGFVNYEKEEDAAKAIEQLNGQSMEHKTLKVAYSQPSGHQTKNINLHVSGLPPTATDDSLKAAALHYGSIVQCRVVKDKSSDQCQGFGFLLFSNRDEAQAAITGLHGSVFPGTNDSILTVKYARSEQKGPPLSYLRKQQMSRFNYNNGPYGAGGPIRPSFQERYTPMTPRLTPYYNSYDTDYSVDGFYGGAGDFSYHGSATSNDAEPIVFVYGIGPHTDEDELWNMFSGFGNIVRVNVMWNRIKGEGKGYGFVTFSSHEEASQAVQYMNGSNYQGRILQVKFKTDSIST